MSLFFPKAKKRPAEPVPKSLPGVQFANHHGHFVIHGGPYLTPLVRLLEENMASLVGMKAGTPVIYESASDWVSMAPIETPYFNKAVNILLYNSCDPRTVLYWKRIAESMKNGTSDVDLQGSGSFRQSMQVSSNPLSTKLFSSTPSSNLPPTPNFPFLLLGVHNVPLQLQSWSWPKFASSSLRREFEKQYGIEPAAPGVRLTPMSDVLNVCEMFEAPWVEIEPSHLENLRLVLAELTNLIILSSPGPIQKPICETVTQISLEEHGSRLGAVEPQALAYTNDHLLIADTGHQQVCKLFMGEPKRHARPVVSAHAFTDPVLVHPTGIGLHSDGSILIVDSKLHRVYRCAAPKTWWDDRVEFSVFAGAGIPDHKDGPYASACFYEPTTMAQDELKDIFVIADTGNNAIRMLKDGIVSTLSDGTFSMPLSARFSSKYGILVADTGDHMIRAIKDGAVTRVAGCGKSIFQDGVADKARFNRPSDAIESTDGSIIFICDMGNNRIRMLIDGRVSTLSNMVGNTPIGLLKPRGFAISPTGDLFVSDTGNQRIIQVSTIPYQKLQQDKMEYLCMIEDERSRPAHKGVNKDLIDALTNRCVLGRLSAPVEDWILTQIRKIQSTKALHKLFSAVSSRHFVDTRPVDNSPSPPRMPESRVVHIGSSSSVSTASTTTPASSVASNTTSPLESPSSGGAFLPPDSLMLSSGGSPSSASSYSQADLSMSGFARAITPPLVPPEAKAQAGNRDSLPNFIPSPAASMKSPNTRGARGRPRSTAIRGLKFDGWESSPIPVPGQPPPSSVSPPPFNDDDEEENLPTDSFSSIPSIASSFTADFSTSAPRSSFAIHTFSDDGLPLAPSLPGSSRWVASSQFALPPVPTTRAPVPPMPLPLTESSDTEFFASPPRRPPSVPEDRRDLLTPANIVGFSRETIEDPLPVIPPPTLQPPYRELPKSSLLRPPPTTVKGRVTLWPWSAGIQQTLVQLNPGIPSVLTPSSFMCIKTRQSFEAIFYKLEISNNSEAAVHWELDSGDLCKREDIVFHVSPSNGTLEPDHSTTIQILINPMQIPEFFQLLRLKATVEETILQSALDVFIPKLTSYIPILIWLCLETHSSQISFVDDREVRDVKNSVADILAEAPPASIRVATVAYGPSGYKAASVAGQTENHYWQIEQTMLTDGKLIGMGSSAAVYKSSLFGMEVAVKKWDVGTRDPTPEDFLAEIQAFTHFQHPKLLRFYGAKESPGQVFVVVEYAANATLHDWLTKSPLDQRTLAKKLEMAIDVAEALSYLHSYAWLHRDVKSLNVLILDNLTAKLADFGCSSAVHKSQPQGIGSFHWMAPEVYHSTNYSTQSDVFSFGMILVELINEDFPNRNSEQIAKGKVAPEQLDPFRSTHGAVVDVIELCCKPNPAERPPLKDVIPMLQQLLDFEMSKPPATRIRSRTQEAISAGKLPSSLPPSPKNPDSQSSWEAAAAPHTIVGVGV